MIRIFTEHRDRRRVFNRGAAWLVQNPRKDGDTELTPKFYSTANKSAWSK